MARPRKVFAEQPRPPTNIESKLENLARLAKTGRRSRAQAPDEAPISRNGRPKRFSVDREDSDEAAGDSFHNGNELPAATLGKRYRQDDADLQSMEPATRRRVGVRAEENYYASAKWSQFPQHDAMMAQRSSLSHTITQDYNPKDYNIPPYFFLSKDGMIATFTWHPPKRVRFRSQYSWKEQGRILTICSDIQSEENTYQEYDSVKAPRLLSFLRSHLQKCIRRTNGQLAYRTAYQLIKPDAAELIRQLPMIVLEDAIPNPQYPGLIWLACATEKGFRPPISIIEWLLGYVRAVADSPFRETFEASASSDPLQLVSRSVAELPTSKRDLLYALQLTKSLQTSAGNRFLIDKTTRAWFERMRSDSNDNHYSKTLYQVHHVPIDGVPNLQPDELELSAVDPCCSDILDILRQELDEEDQQRWPDDVVLKHMLNEKSCELRTKMLVPAVFGGSESKSAEKPPGVNRMEVDLLWRKYKEKISQAQRRILRGAISK
ncbi:uncharacterized protein SPPG_01232 [Spizellomyces punctatus DAOM BR117]|uniref:Uncharacterized protein n=1 Tax=Spizellomyces punctatus (strain DAOM BR117) TaxID=645134 RepID=A0A0L0HS97_SPIPD|nr:uncharacterized protein SPPG_01232 [Spizellomyces punctatus DAOM BR117]KND03775.1 hypothetical protein SPPG_01232 [Spizellomyces punctatus DAOM BR117]|eukprot:XP_016611814.1 hypothetical protein SPPG_01232 [Spizellomyces punctatus DAOM BR117]